VEQVGAAPTLPGVTPPLFDAHLHVVDPAFPLVPNQGYLPPAFTVADYRAAVADLHVVGGAVVSGSFQAFDQSYLVRALELLGPSFVGVTQLPASVADEELLRLDAAGVRAVRFNLARGGSAPVAELDRLARRVHEVVGWHAELYVDARELPGLAGVLRALPAVVVDHLGLHADGTPALLDLVAAGVKVKATGFGRVDLDPAAVAAAVVAVDPGALLAGTDLPSTRARRPFEPADLRLLADAVPAEHHDAVLRGNAAALYLARPRPA
jgi:predicted TIM-barrel fold metal-dependent hydrolase